MGEYFDQVPATIQDHIKAIAKDVKAAEGEDAIEKVAQAWLDKKSVFENKIAEMDMEEVDFLGKDDEQGALVLTYSGSLVNIGPVIEDQRHCTYAFETGPVKSTSNIFKIAVCKGDLSAEEQEENFTRAATIIEEEFVEVNKTIMM